MWRAAQVWKLYNTGCMDFHLFFCCGNVKRLAAMLPEEERHAVRPLWQVTIYFTHVLEFHIFPCSELTSLPCECISMS